MRFAMLVVAVSVYVLFVSVRGTVYVVHRSHVGWCRGVARIRRGIFLGDFRYVGWSGNLFYRYVSILSRSIVVKFIFQIGLAVGVR
jgi:hypothetical protein